MDYRLRSHARFARGRIGCLPACPMLHLDMYRIESVDPECIVLRFDFLILKRVPRNIQ